MNNTFLNLSYPFVYLDSSFLQRTNNRNAQKLSRNLLIKNPLRFKSILDDLIAASKDDAPYYDAIIELQKKGVISNVITFEALNPALALRSPSVISLFGNIFYTLSTTNSQLSDSYSDLVLWGENVNSKKYFSAAMIIMNSQCVVADAEFMSLSVGKGLVQYITSSCTFYVVCANRFQSFDGIDEVYKASPREFILSLYSQM